MVDEDTRYLPPDRPPRKPGQEPTARLTLDAYVRMRMTDDGRDCFAYRLLRSREHVDYRENADYDAAKNDQGLMEAKIRDLEYMLKDPDIIEASEGDEVGPGTLVTLRLLDEDEAEEETYLLALSAE